MNFGILLTPWKLFSLPRSFKNSSNGVASNRQRRSSNQAPGNFETEIPTINHFEEYAALNEQLLRCIFTGEGNSTEAEVIRDQLDVHWHKMSAIEQELMRKRNEAKLSDR
jgi:hypothetical protein